MNLITSNDRILILDIETTGMNKIGIPYKGHRIIEIGIVEIINRHITGNHFHTYLKPDRLIDLEAFKIHGIRDEFLSNKPRFSNVVDKLLSFIKNSELVIHNASFDIGFMDYEFSKLNTNVGKTDNYCKIIDSLAIARKMFPGKKNSLNALCDRYLINKTKRTLHGALLDAEILADIYLLMTSKQTKMSFLNKENKKTINLANTKKLNIDQLEIKIIYANDKERIEHENYLNLITKNGKKCLWNIT